MASKKNKETQGRGDNDQQPRGVAHAPYNFVPLVDGDPIPGEIVSHDRYCEDHFTGYFDVTLETVTPLFVRGMLTEQQVKNDVQAKDFPEPFMIAGKPVIPGSSLRGMLRSLVEIITFGKIHFVSDQLILYRSVRGDDTLVEVYRRQVTDVLGFKKFVYPSKKLQGGYLKRGNSESGWVIQPAKTFKDESIVLVDKAAAPKGKPFSTHQVWIKPLDRVEHTGKKGVKLQIAKTNNVKFTATPAYQPAILIISNTVGGDNNRTWYPAIYAPSEESEPIPISRQIWDTYKEDRDMKRGLPARKLENEGDVLFYLLDDNDELTFFGSTMFFRIPYENSLGQLVDYTYLGPNFVDYAEAMFGYVADEKVKRDPVAYAGRVSVTSAMLRNSDLNDAQLYEEEITPKILSSPKPTTFQHYVEQPSGAETKKGELQHYGDDVRLRGHKLYWRQNIQVKDVVERSEIKDGDTQHTRTKPLRVGVQFTFRVYFENLTEVELGALSWALTLDNDLDSDSAPEFYHMIGMAKPYGMGVVSLRPTLTITDRQSRYKTLFNEDGSWDVGANQGDLLHYIQKFKEYFSIDENERIEQLKAMLRLYDPDWAFPLSEEEYPRTFSYMTIEPNNEYKERPVLPYPLQVEAEYREKEKSAVIERRH